MIGCGVHSSLFLRVVLFRCADIPSSWRAPLCHAIALFQYRSDRHALLLHCLATISVVFVLILASSHHDPTLRFGIKLLDNVGIGIQYIC